MMFHCCFKFRVLWAYKSAVWSRLSWEVALFLAAITHLSVAFMGSLSGLASKDHLLSVLVLYCTFLSLCFSHSPLTYALSLCYSKSKVQTQANQIVPVKYCTSFLNSQV